MALKKITIRDVLKRLADANLDAEVESLDLCLKDSTHKLVLSENRITDAEVSSF